MTRTDPLLWREAAQLVARAGMQFSTGVVWKADRSFLYTIHVRAQWMRVFRQNRWAMPFQPRQFYSHAAGDERSERESEHTREMIFLTTDVTLEQIKQFVQLIDAVRVTHQLTYR